MNRIGALRKERKMSQTDLAKKLNVSQGTLSFWENEKYDIDNESLVKLSEIFEVSTDYILCNTDIRDIKKAPSEEDGDKVTFDDFTYAMNEEAHELTEEEKEKLLELARFFNENRKKGKR